MGQLEELVDGKLQRAVTAILNQFPENLEDYVDEILNYKPVRKFLNGHPPNEAGYFAIRTEGAQFLNQYSLLLANRLQKANPGTIVKRFLQVSATDGKGVEAKKVGTFIVPFSDIKQFVEPGTGYVNLEDPNVWQGLQQLLAERPVTFGDMIYSHNEENLFLGKILGKNGHAKITPVGVTTYVLAEPLDEVETQRRIVHEIGEKLFGKKSERTREKFDSAVEAELNQLFMVGEQYPSLYAALRHTRYFATIPEDIVKNANTVGLNLFSYFNSGNGKTNGQMNKDKLLMRRQIRALEAIKEVAAAFITPPEAVIVTRVKDGESWANKVLMHVYHRNIVDALKSKGSPLNAYLESKGLPTLSPDMKRKDIRDLH